MTKTEKELEELLEPTVIQLGYELYDVEYVKEGSEWFLRLYIDAKEKKIDLDDCEKVSHFISELLDEKDPISTAYNLEVSSCGIERHLREKKHFESAVGENVELKLFTAYEGQRLYVGKLVAAEENKIIILDENDKESKIPLSEISSAKTLFNWEESENE